MTVFIKSVSACTLLYLGLYKSNPWLPYYRYVEDLLILKITLYKGFKNINLCSENVLKLVYYHSFANSINLHNCVLRRQSNIKFSFWGNSSVVINHEHIYKLKHSLFDMEIFSLKKRNFCTYFKRGKVPFTGSKKQPW